MTDRDKTPATIISRDAVALTDQSSSLIRRGLDAVRNRQKHALPLRGKAEPGNFNASFDVAGTPPKREDAEGQFNFAEMHYVRSHVSESYEEIWASHQAVKGWEIAAELGYAPAQHRLGDAYHEGYGLLQDDTLAVRWWHKAAEQGCAAAQYQLGRAYANGEGVLKNFVTAYVWFRLEWVSEMENAPRIFYDPSAEQQMQHLETFMSPIQIAEAQRLVQEWIVAHVS